MMLTKKSTLALIVLALVSGCSHSKHSADTALMSEFESKVGNKVYFAYDSSAISHEAAKTLSAQAEFIKQHAEKSFIIEGHCSKEGTREYNLGLGERRANEALKTLAKHGVELDKLTVISFGKEKPLVDGDDKASLAKNRAAVTVIQ